MKTIKLSIEQARELLGKDPNLDVLIKANFTDEELEDKMAWSKLSLINGYYIDADSAIECEYNVATRLDHRNIFATLNQAKSALAMAQLSQLMKHVNGDWKPDWSNQVTKYVIVYEKQSIETTWYVSLAAFLAFPSANIRDKFLKDHLDLINEYFLMYK